MCGGAGMIVVPAFTITTAKEASVEVRPLATLAPADHFRALGEIDKIFFEASSVQAFATLKERLDFHWLWLGRYLIGEPAEAFVALEAGHVKGYLVGSLVDPASQDATLGLDYFDTFAPQTARYPANLHINVDQTVRSRGIGERLIKAFEHHATVRRAAGVHIVTGAGMRNIGFYNRLGFREVARTRRGAGHVVMLAKLL